MSTTIDKPADWQTDEELSGVFADVRELGKRFNPHHGSDGKFASSNGFKAGAWSGDDEKSQIASHDHIQAQFAESFQNQGMTKEQAESLAQRQADTLGYVYVNGPVTVAMTRGASVLWSDSDRQEFLGNVDELQTRFPLKGDVHITVMGDSAFPQIPGGIVQGETAQLGHPVMRFNADGIKPGGTLVGDLNEGQKYHAPGYADAGAMRYTMAHEWGHATDTNSNAAVKTVNTMADKGGLTSEYGKTNPREAYAEAFASWAIEGDKSPVGKLYNDQFHWSEKFPNGGLK